MGTRLRPRTNYTGANLQLLHLIRKLRLSTRCIC